MPSPTPSMPRQPVGNQPSNELPATEPARGSNNNFRQLTLNQPLNQPLTQPVYQPAQQRPGPHEEPIGTPQATDWYNHGNRNNTRYPDNYQDERPNNFRTRNGDKGNAGTTTQTSKISTESKTSKIPDEGIDPTTTNPDTGTPWLPSRKCTKKIISTAAEVITSTTNSAFSTKCA